MGRFDEPAEWAEPEPEPAERRSRVKLYVDGRDWWVGLYISAEYLYFCVFTVVLRVRRRVKKP